MSVLNAAQEDERVDDLLNHQSLRVKNIIMHPRYTGPENDLALIQLYPSTEDGSCAIFGDNVQPACINQGRVQFQALKLRFSLNVTISEKCSKIRC